MIALDETPATGASDLAPYGARGERLDQTVRRGLSQSLSNVFAALDGLHEIDAAQVSTLTQALESGPVTPTLFGAYVDLVMAVFEDREADAGALAHEILSMAVRPALGLRIVTLTDTDLGVGQAARYRRLFIDDLAVDLRAVDEITQQAAARGLAAALDLLSAGAPTALSELRAIVREIVLVTAPAREDGFHFGGAATFSLWGALAINVARLEDRLDGAITLAHEAAHACLFGLAEGGRLVENDDGELYPSPLRADLRPLEGVAHAAFVAARVTHVLEGLLASGALSPVEIARAERERGRNAAAFREGLATVLANARFTPAGADVFATLSRDSLAVA